MYKVCETRNCTKRATYGICRKEAKKCRIHKEE